MNQLSTTLNDDLVAVQYSDEMRADLSKALKDEISSYIEKERAAREINENADTTDLDNFRL